MLVLAPLASGVEKISIDDDRSPNYLPYRTTIKYRYNIPSDRILLPIPIQAAEHTTDGASRRLVAMAINPPPRDTLGAFIISFEPEAWVPSEALRLELILSDYTIYFDSTAQSLAFAAIGYRNDSVFLAKALPGQRDYSELAIGGAFDRSRVEWSGIREVVLRANIDEDRYTDLLLSVGSTTDLNNRLLVCLQPENMTVQWTRPLPMQVAYGFSTERRDPTDTRLFLIAHRAHDTVSAPTISDFYCHLVTLNGNGDILSNSILGKGGYMSIARYDPANGLVYVTHALPFSKSIEAANTAPTRHQLSAVNGNDSVVYSIDIPGELSGIWLQDVNHDGFSELFTISDLGVIRTYSSDLVLLAESEPHPALGMYTARLGPLEREDSILVFQSGDGVALYSWQLEKLAVIPDATGMPFALGTVNGTLTSVLTAGRRQYTVALLHEQAFSDYLTILWLDNRYYIAMAVTFLAAGFVMVFGYSRRIRSQKMELETAHQELSKAHHDLTETHRALALAQEKIIATEKQKVMKGLSASFAHEIRNALFPAQMSVYRMTEGPGKTPVDRERLEKLLSMTSTSVSRAIALAELISQYTKLESQYLAESTCFAEVVRELLALNAELVEQSGATVTCDGPEDAVVIMRLQHLQIVLNNLLLNAMDAVLGQSSPTIKIQWAVQGGYLEASVSDNGRGIPESDLPNIFEPFFTTKPNSGTGLGLAITRKLINIYGGTINVSGQPGGGTVFTLSLKLWQTESGESIRT